MHMQIFLPLQMAIKMATLVLVNLQIPLVYLYREKSLICWSDGWNYEFMSGAMFMS